MRVFTGFIIMGVIKRQSLLNAVISYAGVGLGYFNFLILFPNILLGEQFGLVQVLVSMGEVIKQFAILGVQNTTLKFFPYFNDRSKKHHGFLSFMLLLALVGTVLSGILMYVFQAPLLSLFAENSPEVLDYYSYLFLLVLLMVIFEVFYAYARSLQKSVVPSFIGDMLRRLLVAVTLLLYFFKVVNFDQFLLLFICTYWVIIVAMMAYLIYLRQLMVPFSFTKELKETFPEIRVYGLYSFLGSAAAVLITRLDIIMLGMLIGLEDPAIYTVAFFIGNVIYVPAKSIILVMMPMVADAWKQNDLGRIGELYHKSAINQMIIGGLIFLGVWLNVEGLMSVLPEKYQVAKYVVLVIGLTRLIDMSMGVNGGIIMTSKYYRFNFVSNFFLIVLGILANWWLIPLYGIVGAAIATLAVTALFNLAKFIFLWTKVGLQPFNQKFILVLLIFGLVWLGGRFLPDWGGIFVTIIWKSILITAVYVSLMYFSKASRAANEFIEDKLKLVFNR